MKYTIIIAFAIFLNSCNKEDNIPSNIVDIKPKSKIEGVWLETYPNDSATTFYIYQDSLIGTVNFSPFIPICIASFYELIGNDSIYSKRVNPVNNELTFYYKSLIIFYNKDSIRLEKYVSNGTTVPPPRNYQDVVLKRIK